MNSAGHHFIPLDSRMDIVRRSLAVVEGPLKIKLQIKTRPTKAMMITVKNTSRKRRMKHKIDAFFDFLGLLRVGRFAVWFSIVLFLGFGVVGKDPALLENKSGDEQHTHNHDVDHSAQENCIIGDLEQGKDAGG